MVKLPICPSWDQLPFSLGLVVQEIADSHTNGTLATPQVYGEKTDTTVFAYLSFEVLY